jgi:hypothetical protein
MAIIKLIDAPKTTAEDVKALKAAELWTKRIPETFVTDRSRQTQIGISEVGMECRKCVARKLAQKPRSVSGAWYPFLGTAVHDSLEAGFTANWPKDYHLEERLHVHSYKQLELGGSCDMFDIKNGVVNDWKVVGKSAIAEANRGKVKMQYRVQAMLYGYGWEQKGFDITHVALSFLPREDTLENAVVVLMRYDRQLALDSLSLLESMIDAAEIAGWDAVIENQPKAGFCFSCKDYDQAEYGGAESLIP